MYKDVEATISDVILIIAQEPVFPCEHSIQGKSYFWQNQGAGREAREYKTKETNAGCHAQALDVNSANCVSTGSSLSNDGPTTRLHSDTDHCFIVHELCESRRGRPGLSVLTSFLVSVDVKNY